MRISPRTAALGLASGLVVGASVLLGAPGTLAGPAAPAAISLDCSTSVPNTTITGRVGDTVQLTNTSSTCALSLTTGVVTVTGLSGSNLGAGQTAVATIVASGTFTISPTSGSAGAMTVVIGDPGPAPAYTITFDANGGNCSSNPLVITAATTDWYALPTEGTGPFECFREGYELLGWVRGDTLQFAGTADRVPDVPVGSQASAADHVTFYAAWRPRGVELTLDANVAANDSCVTAGGEALQAGDRTTTTLVSVAELARTSLPSSAPCTPPGHTLVGWKVSGDGGAATPATAVAELDSTDDNRVTLYALWRAQDRSVCLEPRSSAFQVNGFDGYRGTLTVTMTGYCGSTPGSYEIETAASLSGSSCEVPGSCSTTVPFSIAGGPVTVDPARLASPTGSGQVITVAAGPDQVSTDSLMFRVDVSVSAVDPSLAAKEIIIEPLSDTQLNYTVFWDGIKD